MTDVTALALERSGPLVSPFTIALIAVGFGALLLVDQLVEPRLDRTELGNETLECGIVDDADMPGSLYTSVDRRE